MTIKPLIILPDPILRQVSAPVEQIDDAVRAFADDMLETMYDAPGIGLAAIQVGVARRMLVIDLAKEDEPKTPMVFINPEILATSDEPSLYEEGCLSIPEYYAEVERPASLTVRYLGLDGAAHEMSADGLLATCLQHEIDHLNGVLFIDHISKLKRDMVIRKFTKAASGPSPDAMALTVVFMGTPDFSVPTLKAVNAAGHTIAAVYTQPPRPAGRGMAERPSPVQTAALELGLNVSHPASLKPPAEQAAFAALNADIAVVVAYGLLLPQAILDAPRHGALNGHGSLLPRWRGAAPIQRAIEAGDRETGMMIMRMEAGLDTGPVALSETLPIGERETAAELHDRLSAASARLMVDALDLLERNALTFETQEAITASTGRLPVYARKIDKAEARLDFTLPARDVARKINAFSPFPGAWSQLDGQPERFKLLRAEPAHGSGAAGTLLDDGLRVACGDGAIRILDLQKQGGRPMKAADFLRGQKLPAGMRFS